jgi:hypothetical protein
MCVCLPACIIIITPSFTRTEEDTHCHAKWDLWFFKESRLKNIETREENKTIRMRMREEEENLKAAALIRSMEDGRRIFPLGVNPTRVEPGQEGSHHHLH